MKVGTEIRTARQRLRHFRNDEIDRAFFHRVNSDERIARFFAQRWTRGPHRHRPRPHRPNGWSGN